MNIINEITLNIPFRAVTFQTHRLTRFGKIYKTKHQLEFISSINKFLSSNKAQLRLFGSSYVQGKHFLESQCFFYYSDLITRQKTISRKIPDIDNGKKLVQDLIFKQAMLDDSCILRSTDEKRLGKDSIIFTLKILELGDFLK